MKDSGEFGGLFGCFMARLGLAPTAGVQVNKGSPPNCGWAQAQIERTMRAI